MQINPSRRSMVLLVTLVTTLGLTGCVADLGGDEAVGVAAEAEETSNSLTWNSLTSNSLTSNSLTSNSLTSNSLTSNSLTSNAAVATALSDPASRDVLKYIVGCALPASQSISITIDGVPYTFAGQLGLAPGWGLDKGNCDGGCLQAVSACVLSRINYLGVPVPISLRGGKLHATAAELLTYPVVDGTYYGNIFSSPQIRYACLPPGVLELTRVCGPTINGCVVDVMGPCVDLCDARKADGSFPNCRDLPRSDPGATGYNPLTAFLQ